MESTVTENGNEATIAMKGHIDTRTAKDAEAVFKEVATTHDRIVLDMSEVSYVSSAGIRALRNLYMILYRKGGSLSMEGIGENVMSVLKMTGLLDLIG